MTEDNRDAMLEAMAGAQEAVNIMVDGVETIIKLGPDALRKMVNTPYGAESVLSLIGSLATTLKAAQAQIVQMNDMQLELFDRIEEITQ